MSEDKDYKPPQSAEELLERYAAGKRRFPRTDLSGADLSGADLSGAELSDSNLSDTDLSDADLRWIDLARADLTRADLARADLARADLSGADLSGADLSGADLISANLSEAVLIKANLSRATLMATILTEADLTEADLSAANLNGASLLKTILKGTKWGRTSLGSINLSSQILRDPLHTAPSSVGVDTLQATAEGISKHPSNQGEIETFFRGCGVPDDMIEFFRSWIGKPIEFYSCFISYSHTNKSFARRLEAQLQANGLRCWHDEKDAVPGQRILDMVNQAIRSNDKLLLLCSEASLTSWWVQDEIRKAHARERRENRLIIIPLMLDRYLLDKWDDGLAEDIRSRLAADFTGWESNNAKFEESFENVVKALRADEGAREAAPKPKL